MSIKDSPQYKQLREAMESLKELKIPDHLQQTALAHLLQDSNEPGKEPRGHGDTQKTGKSHSASTGKNLRDFVAKLNPKGAVAEIPSLLYWAKEHESKEKANERDVVELYRRANLRPPRQISQSMRDLSSKKYLRLESVKDDPGYFRLSRTGEDFVLYDLQAAEQS
ncbi:MAG: hypothetical protein HYS89_01175 [Candidatus Colwellbacteria bacterium]|nr:hypothetical protein [Candidatus Colwellbacteria bacterium]